MVKVETYFQEKIKKDNKKLDSTYLKDFGSEWIFFQINI